MFRVSRPLIEILETLFTVKTRKTKEFVPDKQQNKLRYIVLKRYGFQKSSAESLNNALIDFTKALFRAFQGQISGSRKQPKVSIGQNVWWLS